MEFKDRIRQLRAEAKLTAHELAVKFNKSESAVRMWEIGKAKPDADTLILLAQMFNCTTDYLLGLNTHKNHEQELLHNTLTNALVEAINGVSCPNKDSLIASLIHIFERQNYENFENIRYDASYDFFLWLDEVLQHLKTYASTHCYTIMLGNGWVTDKEVEKAAISVLRTGNIFISNAEYDLIGLIKDFGRMLSENLKIIHLERTGDSLSNEMDFEAFQSHYQAMVDSMQRL